MPDPIPDSNAIPRGRELEDRPWYECSRSSCRAPMSGYQWDETPVEGVCLLCVSAHYEECERCHEYVLCRVGDEMAQHYEENREEVPE